MGTWERKREAGEEVDESMLTGDERRGKCPKARPLALMWEKMLGGIGGMGGEKE